MGAAIGREIEGGEETRERMNACARRHEKNLDRILGKDRTRFIRVLKRIEVHEGDKWVRLDPHFGFKVSFEIEFGQAAIDATGQQIGRAHV